MFEGAIRRRRWWYELALFHAWHVAAFTATAMRPRGRFPQWETIRARFHAAVEPPTTKPAEQAPRQTGEDLKAMFQAAFASVIKPRPPKGRS